MRRVLKWTAIGLGGLLVLALLGVLGAFMFIRSDSGRAYVSATLNSALASPDQKITVTGLEGALPFHARIAKVEIADRRGVWLTLRNAAFDLDSGALWGGTARIETLAADEIDVLRQPLPAVNPPPKPAEPSATGFALPKLPVAVELDRLSVPRIALAAGVAGPQPVVLQTNGEAKLHAGAGHVRLQVARIDGQTGSVELKADYGPPAGGGADVLDLQLHATEPSGVMLSGLSPDGSPRPLKVDLAGRGPLSGWKGRLDGTAGADVSVGADLAIARRGTDFSVGVKGAAHAAALLSEQMQQTIGDDVEFDIGATAADAGPLGLDRLTLKVAAGTLTAAGRYDPRGNAVSAKLDANGSMAPAGKLALGILLSGTTDKPVAKIKFQGTDIDAGSATIADAEVTLDANPASGGRVRVTGTGKLSGIALPDGKVPAGLGEPIDLAADLTTDPQGQVVDIAKVTVGGDGLDVNVSGKLDHGALSGHAKIAAGDLSRFAQLANLALAGSVEIDADASSRDGKSIDAKLTGRTNGLKLGIPAADAALGPSVSIDAAVNGTVGATMSLDTLKVAAAQISVDASGKFNQAAGTADAHAVIAAPHLEKIAPGLAGGITLTADASGTHGVVKLDGTGIRAGGARIDKLEATLTAADFANKTIDIAASLVSGKVNASLSGVVSQPEPNRVAVDKLVLKGPGTDVKGAVSVDLTTRLARGDITAEIGDLSGWTPIVGQPVAGKASLTLKLRDQAKGSADATLDATNLSFGAGQAATGIQHVHFSGHATDLMGKLVGNLDLQATAIKSPAAAINTAKLTVTADKTVNFNASTTGSVGTGKMAIATSGSLVVQGQAQRLNLAKLDGHYANLQFHLGEPLIATRQGNAVKLADLDLALNEGRIAGNAAYDGRTVSVGLKATALPIGKMAALVGRTDVGGSLGFDIAVNGAATDPRGTATVTVDQLKFANASAQNAPPVNISVSADLVSRAVRFKGRLDGAKGETALGFSGTVPVVFAPGGSVSIPQNGALQAKVQGSGRLEPLNEIAPVGEDRMGGSYSIDLAVEGTPSAPRAAGNLKVMDGSYTNSVSGMTLRGLEVQLDGTEQHFQLSRFDANDGGSGKLTMSGKVDLAGGKGPTFDMSAKLSSFTLARSDEVTAVLSGDAKVHGSLAKPIVDADLTIERADINIPQRLPPSVVTLNVVRINSTRPAPVQTAATGAPPPPPASPFAAVLNVKIHDHNRTFVRGDGLDSEWKGELTVGGTSVSPLVTGELNSLNGTFSLLGTDFTLQRGVVYFTGSTSPTFDIQAQAQTADITAVVEVQGTPDAPKLTLTSTPPLPQDEVLSRVMFGSGVGSITPVQGLQLAAAAASLAGGGPGMIDKLRSKTGLDRLAIGSSSTSGSSSSQQGGGLGSGTTLSGGKYIAPGVYVGVAQGISGGSTRAQVEVNVTNHVTVNATTGAGGNTGSSLGVQYQLDY